MKFRVFTAYVLVCSVLTLAPLWAILFVIPQGRLADRFVKGWSRLILWLSGSSPSVRGLAQLKEAHPAVIVVNHSSYLDAIALMAALPVNFRFVANHHAGGWPLVGLAIRKGDHLIVDRGRLADRHAVTLAMIDTLKSGISVLVFPEGGIDPEGKMRPFQPGAFRVAMESGRPIVPVILRGTRNVMAGGVFNLRPGRLDVSIQTPIHSTVRDRHEIARLRDGARAQMVEELGCESM